MANKRTLVLNNAKIVPSGQQGKFVIIGFLQEADEQRGWAAGQQIRSSLILSEVVEEGKHTVETLNTVYELV